MTGEVSAEATGDTVGEAKRAAVRELERAAPGLDRETVRFQVVSEGTRGVLGIGYEPARVVATAPGSSAPLAARDTGTPPTNEEELARELLERATAAMGVAGRVTVLATEGEVHATVACADPAALIGHHGQTIDALETLANALAYRARGDERRRVVLDADGYRDRRRSALETSARRAAERASTTGAAVALEPMSSAERRLVHEALKDDPEVETGSEGVEPNRYVVVVPRRGPV